MQIAEPAQDTIAAVCHGVVAGEPGELKGSRRVREGARGNGALPPPRLWPTSAGAYVTLGRTTGTNAGSPTGREPHGHGVLIVVVELTIHQGGRESRPQGEGAQATGYPKTGRYA
jgi:hypothetical protein